MKGKERRRPGLAFTVLLSLVVLTLSLPAFAQTYPFREYTSDDGLPQLETMGAMQDRQVTRNLTHKSHGISARCVKN